MAMQCRLFLLGEQVGEAELKAGQLFVPIRLFFQFRLFLLVKEPENVRRTELV
ncbi:hypothetical protein [Bombella apis]|uniref:hypothetical protein n=1 Tax=Bombella apis TaxID=1785988 RepID=UPI0024A93503|nr:hypothetical protein [Bombella apis]